MTYKAPANPVTSAFIMAAGHGTRMRPLTDTMPKPMVAVGGKPLINHIIEKLTEAGVNNITINTHYLNQVIEKHIKSINRPQINISHEPVLLDTGGGIKKALQHIGDSVFYHINGDAFWTDNAQGTTALSRLSEAWDDSAMDILMLLIPVAHMTLTEGVGDYDIMPDGRAVRSKNKSGQFMFTGIRLTHPRIFKFVQDEIFSFLPPMDEAEKQGRLHAIIHDGEWHHISTPRDVESINSHLINKLKEK